MGWCTIVKVALCCWFSVFGVQGCTYSIEIFFLCVRSVYFPIHERAAQHRSSDRECHVVASNRILNHFLPTLSVSFFGASHINMPLQEAKLSTNIRLKFRSRQSNAMIFLTSGRTDHCLLTLNDGRIKFQLKINEYETEVNINLMHRRDYCVTRNSNLSPSFGPRNSIHLTISCGMKWWFCVMKRISRFKSTSISCDERCRTRCES